MTPPAPDRAPSVPPAARRQAASGVDVVVPVKPLAQAKSRLALLGDDVRRDLALAFVRDVLAALGDADGVREVVVVTADDQVAALAAGRRDGRTRVVPDSEPRELNRALHQGVAALVQGRTRGAGEETVVLALCADLPALTSRALAELLAAAPVARPGFVADHTGTGTTAYLAPPALFDPRFGPGSRDAHARDAVDLTAGVPFELRADVDSPEDLAALLSEAHLGAATRAVLDRHRLDRTVLLGVGPSRA